MNLKRIVRVAAFSLLLIAGSASAQVVTNPSYGVNVTTTPVNTAVTPGSTGATLGTVTFMGNPTGTSLTSLPITITPGNGASASNLSNCQLVSSNGTVLNTGANASNAIVSGSNTFTFNQAMPVSSANGATTLTVRCDVSSSAPAGSTFLISAGQPIYAPALNVNLAASPTVQAGTNSATLGTITLSGLNSGSNVNISSIPLTITAGNGGSTTNLSNCMIVGTNGVLNAGGNVQSSIVNGAPTTFTLNAPLTVAAGGSQLYAVTCNVSAAAPAGSTFTVSVDPNSFAATNPTTGASVATTANVGSAPNGLPAATSGTVVVSGAGTPITTTTTPGVPNTGAGGNAAENAFILALSALIALSGMLYMRYELR